MQRVAMQGAAMQGAAMQGRTVPIATVLLLAAVGLAIWITATFSMLSPARLQAILALFSLC